MLLAPSYEARKAKKTCSRLTRMSKIALITTMARMTMGYKDGRVVKVLMTRRRRTTMGTTAWWPAPRSTRMRMRKKKKRPLSMIKPALSR